MPKIEIYHEYGSSSIEFECYCDTCGDGICNHVEETGQTRNRREPFIRVRACETCMEDAESKGRERGQQEADEQLQAELDEANARIKELEAELERRYAA